MELNRLTATDAAPAIASGEFTAEDLARSCLARNDRREPTVRAWVPLDVFNLIWTLAPRPVRGGAGVPGAQWAPGRVQLVGSRFEDGRVLAIGDTVSRLFSESVPRGSDTTTGER